MTNVPYDTSITNVLVFHANQKDNGFALITAKIISMAFTCAQGYFYLRFIVIIFMQKSIYCGTMHGDKLVNAQHS